jgi:pseudoazurin
MIRKFTLGLAVATLMGTAAYADVIEIRMLNVGSDGARMVFEPDFVQINPGDTVQFIAADRGHNAETVEDMIPAGADGFVGRINEELEITLTEEGVYAVICKPHYAMGMVMIIAVGEAEMPDGFLEGRIPRQALNRFQSQLENL